MSSPDSLPDARRSLACDARQPDVTTGNAQQEDRVRRAASAPGEFAILPSGSVRTMISRTLPAAIFLAATLSVSAFADNPDSKERAVVFHHGEVQLETATRNPLDQRSLEAWHYRDGDPFAFISRYGLGPGHVLSMSPTSWLFHDGKVMSSWGGEREGDIGLFDHFFGVTEIFRDDAELGEIAPMRSGRFLVAERRVDGLRDARLIEFDRHGIVTTYSFPRLIDWSSGGNTIGAHHIELLADQCTVLYTLGDDHVANARVGRLNICTHEAQPDFAALAEGEYAGAIRQLPNGEVVVANGSALLRFDATGALLERSYVSGITHIALSADGSTVWSAGVVEEVAWLRRAPIARGVATSEVSLGNPGSSSWYQPVAVSNLFIVGEWRASNPPARMRVVRR
jgi:hypothetical protein